MPKQLGSPGAAQSQAAGSASSPLSPEPESGKRTSGMTGRDYIKQFPATSGKPAEGSSIGTTSSVALQKTSETLSRWATGLTLWSKKQSTEIMSGKAMLKAKQAVVEKFDPGSKTVDTELINMFETVKELEHDLRVLIELSKETALYMTKAAEAQLALSACFEHLSQSSVRMKPELGYHQRMQDVLGKNATGLIETFTFLRDKIKEFVDNEMIKSSRVMAEYDDARMGYDAARANFEQLKAIQSPKTGAAEARFLEAYNLMSDARQSAWVTLNGVLQTKEDLFDRQLGGLENAVLLYIHGNHAGMEDAQARLAEGRAERAAETSSGDGIGAASGEQGSVPDADDHSLPSPDPDDPTQLIEGAF